MIPENQIICGDCAAELAKLPDNSIDLIFVDPPYGREGIYLYEIIAKEAARVLKPGRFAVFYASNYWMDIVFPACCKYLSFFYIFHIIFSNENTSIFPRKIFAGGKIIMVFSKGKAKPTKWVNNVLRHEAKQKCKSHRKDNWEQPVADAEYFISNYSEVGDIVLDACVGSGTTCVAAKKLGRRYIGIDISEEQCIMAEKRLSETNHHFTPIEGTGPCQGAQFLLF